MIEYITSLYALAAATLAIAGQDELVKCTPGEYHIIGKTDCTGYYLCVFGNPVEMPPCPPGSVFSSSSNVCVSKGSIYDDCKKTTDGKRQPQHRIAGSSPEERCNLNGGVFPHPTECQAFYNCSVRYTWIPRFFEQHLVECPYPQFFNTETKQCDHFENVKCGTRTEFKDGCKLASIYVFVVRNKTKFIKKSNDHMILSSSGQYKSNMCKSSQCIPCNVHFPSCEGKRDGINVHPDILWTPFYVVCYKERTVKEDRCQADVNGRTQFFHPEKNECVSLDMIPREHGGMSAVRK
ncbi:hypothetical protein MAR_012872 [Mya arenaria]|uniref:Chitin-binding type-2 domain-containing protein n=1 Tax=Mya arenaria TaxID=6604 RepID=A0ABY7FY86_MYAAR|nr:hypothetical protein MAR_012872 [Mya arenaria]